MLRSGLMPRGLALLGVIGCPLQTLAGTGVLFDLYDAGGPVQSIATIPGSFGSSRWASTPWSGHSRRLPSSGRKGVLLCIPPWKPVELNRP